MGKKEVNKKMLQNSNFSVPVPLGEQSKSKDVNSGPGGRKEDRKKHLERYLKMPSGNNEGGNSLTSK